MTQMVLGEPRKGHNVSAPCKEAVLTAIRYYTSLNRAADANAISDYLYERGLRYSPTDVRRQARQLVAEKLIEVQTKRPLTWMLRKK